VDECSTNVALTTLYARAPKGERAFGRAPRNRGKNLTLIASLSTEGVGAAMSVEGATDGAAFETYVEHFLVPTLKEGQMVVMDNLQVHKSTRVRELIEGAGAQVLFLPPTRRTSRPSKRPSRRSRASCAGPGPAPARPSWKRPAGRSMPSAGGMPWAGSDTAATASPITRYEKRSRACANRRVAYVPRSCAKAIQSR